MNLKRVNESINGSIRTGTTANTGVSPSLRLGALGVSSRILRTVLVAIVFAGISCAFAAERSAEQVLKAVLAEKSESGSVFVQGTLDGVDYRKLLRGAAAKDDSALHGLFRYTVNGRLMGEGAESNCDILRQLLRLWGDAAYARVLAAEPPKVRVAVIAALDYAWPHPGWQPKEFPATYRLAKHDSTR